MTLNKKKMVREIGRRTRLLNKDVQKVVEALIEVWTEALIDGEKIEVQNFFVLKTIMVDRGINTGTLNGNKKPPRVIKKLIFRPSKKLKRCIQQDK